MNSFEKAQAEPFKPHQCMHWSDGRRCRQYAMHNEYFCFRHRIDPTVNIVPSEPFSLPPFLTDRAQIQAALGEVLSRLAAKTIDDKRAGLALYTLQNAISNLNGPPARLPRLLDAGPIRRRRRRILPRWQPQHLESSNDPVILTEAPRLDDTTPIDPAISDETTDPEQPQSICNKIKPEECDPQRWHHDSAGSASNVAEVTEP